MPAPDMYRGLMTFINHDVPFARHCGVTVSELDGHGAVATLGDGPHLRNHVGTVHAGALFTAAESASGACMLGVVGDRLGAIAPVVRSAAISYRRPAGGPITASAYSEVTPEEIEAELAAGGRCDLVVDVRLHDADGELVATAEFAWHLRQRDLPSTGAGWGR